MSTHQKIHHTQSNLSELPRLRLLDRLALRGGLALIEWAHRTRPMTEPMKNRRPDLGRHLDTQVSHRELTEARHRLNALG